MKRLFLIGILLGFAGSLAAAHWVPWVRYDRLPSQTSVVANGGRQETFVIRLPADRIVAFGGNGQLRGNSYPSGFDALAAAGETAPLVEHFKVRDSAGSVIGVAARHRVVLPDGVESTWLLSIPSRGSLVLAGPGEPNGRVDSELKTHGYVPGTAWSGDVALAVAPDADATRTISSTGEFRDLAVQFTEIWALTGVTEHGELRGTIVLDTIGRRTL